MIRCSSLLLLLSVSPGHAQTVTDCDWRVNAQALIEPWEDNTKVFANGNVRLAVTDTVEPAAGAYHLLVLSPPFNELGERQCRTVTLDESLGFSSLSLQEMESDYDPDYGLIFVLPAAIYDPETGGGVDKTLVITLNQSNGTLTASFGSAVK